MYSDRRRTRSARSAARVMCLLVVAACGEERAEFMLGQTREVSGVVVDGYLEGATVFLDLNENHALDADEPHTTTDAKGAFKLTVQGMDAETFAAAYLHASVPDSAKDADDHGATLREAGKAGFTLLAPASAFSAGDAGSAVPVVISPLSALVAGEMLRTGHGVAEAKATVQARLGLAGKDLLQDFVATPDVVLHNVARAAAVSLGEAERSAGSAVDGGVPREPGKGVVDALASVQERLPGVVDALGLREAKEPAALDSVKSEWASSEARARPADAGVTTVTPGPASAGERADAGTKPPEPMRDGGLVKLPEPTRDAGLVKPPELESERDSGRDKQPEPARDAGLVKPAEPPRDAAIGELPEPPRDGGLVKPPEPPRDGGLVKPSEPARDGGLVKLPEPPPDGGLVKPPEPPPA